MQTAKALISLHIHIRRYPAKANLSINVVSRSPRLYDIAVSSHRRCLFTGYTSKYVVELQWLERLWDNAKLFEKWVVRATEG